MNQPRSCCRKLCSGGWDVTGSGGEPSAAGAIHGLILTNGSRDNKFTLWLEGNFVGARIDSDTRNNLFVGGSFTSNTTDYVDNGTNTVFLAVNDTGVTLTNIGAATSTDFAITDLLNCDLKTNGSGSVYCGTDSQGVGADWPFTPNTGYQSTTTVMGFLGGLFSTASSTFSSSLYLPSLTQGVLYTGTNGLTQTTATGTVTGGDSITVDATRFVLGGNLDIDCDVASGSQSGCLSSTDWTTFNNSLDALGSGYATTTQTQGITFSTTTQTFNGLTIAQRIIPTSGALTFTPNISGTLDNTGLTNSTISGISLGSNLANLTATDATLTFSGTYNGSAARTIGLNLANPNTWSVLQTFNYSSSTVYSSFNIASTSGLVVSNSVNLFGGGAKTSANALCIQLTGHADLCDGGDATGSGGAADFIWATTYNALNAATTSNLWAQGVLNASSTVTFGTATKPAFRWDATNGRLGIGTLSPSEILHLSVGTGEFGTFRLDSGSTQGYFWAYDGDDSVNIGSNSDATVNFKQGNATKGYISDSTGNWTIQNSEGDDSIFAVTAPSAQPEEATISTILDLGGGNTEFIDWTIEDFAELDHLATVNIGKTGTGQLLPFGIRFWNADAGIIASQGKFNFLTDPSGATAIGSYATTTSGASNAYSKLIALQVSSSTASTIFTVEDGTTDKLTVSGTGFGTTTLAGLDISAQATSTSNVGFNITNGCYAINGTCLSGGTGLSSYDAWTHPAAGKSATTSEIWTAGFLSTASSTIVGNATTTGSLYVGSMLSLPSGGVIDFNHDILLTHSTDLLALSGGTLRTNDIQLTTGSGIRTGTTAGNTLLFQARDVDGAAYTTLAQLTANNDPTFTASSTAWSIRDGLWIPNAAAPFANAVGSLALDTTSNNLLLGTSTTGNIVAASATTTLYAFTATTSPYISGSTMNLPAHFNAQVVTGIICKVSSGTSFVINLSNAAGSSDTNTITCTTTETQYAVTTNNTFAAYGGIRLEFGTKTGDTGDISIRIMGYRTSN